MQRKSTAIVAVFVLLGSLAFIWWHLKPGSPRVKPDRFIGFGQALADQTAQAVQDHGRIVAVINPPHQVQGEPLHTVWESFQSELKQHGGLTLAATEVLTDDGTGTPPGAGCSRDQLKQMLENHADASAIVFLFGLPGWGIAGRQLPASVSPKVIVGDTTCIGSKSQYGGYFSHGILEVVIARKAGLATAPADQSKTPREAFQEFYQITTPQNYESMPE